MHFSLFSLPMLNLMSVYQEIESTFSPHPQSLFREWLAAKENALSEVQTSNFKDAAEMNTNVRRLAVSERFFF